MSCSNWNIPDFEGSPCGGQVKFITYFDCKSGMVVQKEFRKWEHETVERLKDIEAYFVDIENYEAAIEVRDEMTLKKLGL